MNSRFGSHFRAFVSFTAALGSAAIAGGAVIVQWGNVGGDTTIISSFADIANNSVLDLATPASPAVGAAYYPNNTGRTPVFFQGVSGGSFNASYPDNGVGMTGNALFFQDSNVSDATDLFLTYLWTQEGDGGSFGFMEGYDGVSGGVQLSSLSIQGIREAESVATSDISYRWVVQKSDGSFYISDSTAFESGSYRLDTVTDLTSINWYDYDPQTDVAAIGSSIVGATFTDITGVGYRATVEDDGSNLDYGRVIYFAATAIPEPKHISLLLGLAVGMLYLNRRRGRAAGHQAAVTI